MRTYFCKFLALVLLSSPFWFDTSDAEGRSRRRGWRNNNYYGRQYANPYYYGGRYLYNQPYSSYYYGPYGGNYYGGYRGYGGYYGGYPGYYGNYYGTPNFGYMDYGNGGVLNLGPIQIPID